MSKKINWQNGKYSSSVKSGTYRSMKDKFAKSADEQREYEQIQAHREQLLPVMSELLKIRMLDRTPLNVMRPLNYQTSELQKSDRGGRFVDTVKQITPGSQLIFKNMNQTMQYFLFEDARTGQEHEISFVDREKLMTQTDIYNVASKYLASNKENE